MAMDRPPMHRGWLARWRERLKRAAYSGCGRDRWQRPVELITALQIRPRACLAEIGSGGGYFTFRLATAAGPQAAGSEAVTLRDFKSKTATDTCFRGRPLETTLSISLSVRGTRKTSTHWPHTSARTFRRRKRSPPHSGICSMRRTRSGALQK
jgi:hypothetical protein